MPQYVSFSSTLLGPTCLIQHGTASMGYDLNDASVDPKQPDWQSCQSFCLATYPNSTHFVYFTTNDSFTSGHEWCKCKSALGNIIKFPGRIAGEVACTTMATTDPCPIEVDMGNPTNNLNNGNTDPKQNDTESCRSFCESNYPTAKFFVWNQNHNCWCKSSDNGKRQEPGKYHGEICRGSTTTTATTTTTTTTTSTVTTPSNCKVEHGMAYEGCPLNSGMSEPRHPDWQSCQAFCNSNHSSAPYFSYITNDTALSNYKGRCFCECSNASRREAADQVRGEVNCQGKKQKYTGLLTAMTLLGTPKNCHCFIHF